MCQALFIALCMLYLDIQNILMKKILLYLSWRFPCIHPIHYLWIFLKINFSLLSRPLSLLSFLSPSLSAYSLHLISCCSNIKSTTSKHYFSCSHKITTDYSRAVALKFTSFLISTDYKLESTVFFGRIIIHAGVVSLPVRLLLRSVLSGQKKKNHKQKNQDTANLFDINSLWHFNVFSNGKRMGVEAERPEFQNYRIIILTSSPPWNSNCYVHIILLFIVFSHKLTSQVAQW